MTASLTAGDLAAALVAAAKVMGVPAHEVFEPKGRRARTLAGAALKASTGLSALTLAGPLRLAAPELSPSLLARSKITTDMLLEVVEEIGGPAGAAALSQGKPPATSAGLAEADEPARDAVQDAVVQDVGADKGPDRVLPAPERSAETPAPRAPAVKRGGTGWRARSAKAAPKPEQVRDVVTRLKPVSAAVARYGAWFAAADWDLEEIAELFDVHPDGLADALEFGVAA